MKLICTKNTSTALPYNSGVTYEAEYLGGGDYAIKDGSGSEIIAPLNGHYLTFEAEPNKTNQ